MRSSDSGNSLVELALLLPVMVALLFGVMDFGRVTYAALAVTHAATAGAKYGAQSLANSQNNTGMVNAATAAATDIQGFTATAARSCRCWSTSAGSETANSCSATCVSPEIQRVYVSVTGTATFNTFLNYPGIPTSVTITRTARMRAQ